MPDMRTERWAVHRAEMRERYAESAMQTIDSLGPHVSIREIAAEAKIPKPTLYRYFTDKAELANAIAERIRDTFAETFTAALQRPGITSAQFVREVLHAFLDRVLERPNIFRFLVLTMSESEQGADHAMNRGSNAAANIASLLSPLVSPLGGAATIIDLDAHMIVGTVISATDWWLRNTSQDTDPQQFVDHVEKYVRAMLQATAEVNGIWVDFDAPITELLETGSSKGLS